MNFQKKKYLCVLGFIFLMLPLSASNEQDSAYIVSHLNSLKSQVYTKPSLVKDSTRYYLNLSEKKSFYTGKYKAHNILGAVHYFQSEFDSCEYHHQQALQMATEARDQVNMQRSYYNLANLYFSSNKHILATKYFLKCLEFENEYLGPYHVKMRAYAAMAYIQVDYLNFPKALEYAKESYDLVKNTQDSTEICYAANTMGDVYSDTKDYDKSLEYYLTGLKFAKTNTISRINSYVCLRDHFLLVNDYESSLKYVDSVNFEMKSAYMPAVNVGNQIAMGKIQLRNGNIATAEKSLLKALENVKHCASDELTIDLLGEMASLYSTKREYSKAYEFMKQKERRKDSLISKQNSMLLTNLISEYQNEKIKKEINAKENQILEQKRQAYFYISSIVFLTLLLIILIVWYYYRLKVKEKEYQKTLAKMDLEKMHIIAEGEEHERAKISSQMIDTIKGDIAFLTYALSAVKSEIKNPKQQSDIQDIIDQVGRTLNQLRDVSNELAPPDLSGENFLESLRSYCTFTAYANDLDIKFQHFGTELNYPKREQIHIYRIIQEVLSNIVTHAQAKSVLIQLNAHAQKVILTIQDDGIGFDTKNMKKGVGIKNIESRLSILKGQMFLDSDASGTTLVFEIPHAKEVEVA